jgi:hypothetical protein
MQQLWREVIHTWAHLFIRQYQFKLNLSLAMEADISRDHPTRKGPTAAALVTFRTTEVTKANQRTTCRSIRRQCAGIMSSMDLAVKATNASSLTDKKSSAAFQM